MNETQEIVTNESTLPAASEISAESEMSPEASSSEIANESMESSAPTSTETPDSICPPEAQEKRQKWSSFVEGPAVDFFTGYKLEKMTIDDGSGNKAKFSRTKDSGIKIEYTSSVLL